MTPGPFSFSGYGVFRAAVCRFGRKVQASWTTTRMSIRRKRRFLTDEVAFLNPLWISSSVIRSVSADSAMSSSSMIFSLSAFSSSVFSALLGGGAAPQFHTYRRVRRLIPRLASVKTAPATTAPISQKRAKVSAISAPNERSTTSDINPSRTIGA